MSDLYKGLNESQKKAVFHNEGPLLVLAGAGSGKTRVLTTRIARLVGEKICRPDQILAVTFTNKAAREMKERIASLTSPASAEEMTLCTFHSLGAKILREDGESIGLKKSFSIIDEHDKISTLKGILRATGVRGLKNEDPQEIAVKISLAKNGSLGADDFKEANPDERKLNRVFLSYNSILLKRQTVDFDDLLLLPLQLFKRHPQILSKYQKKFKYVSIDEFQDTNAVQMQLASLLAFPEHNIMVVGDDDQGIYSWRGAEIENILSFSSNFENCKTVVLDKNYRSTRQILDGAHAVISNNRVRKQKHITAVAGDGDPILHYKGDDEIDEAVWIASVIAENDKHTSFKYNDHAILLRTNAMMRRYEEELRRNGVPYRVSGAMSFFERKEIKDLIAYLRFFANPHDELSMMRVIKVPNKGITPSTLEKLDDFAALRKMSLWDALLRHSELHEINEAQHQILNSFLNLYNKYAAQFETGSLSASVRDLFLEIGYFDHLARAYKEEGESNKRKENIDEFIHGIEIYEQKYRRKKPTLDGYLQEIALITNDEDEEENDNKKKGVILMTLHKSKGLEFPVVFLAGLDSDYVPSPRAVEEGKVDEERRLFYVGMTRAQKRLYLTYPGTKVFRTKIRTVTPCPFIREIPEEFLDGKLGEKQDEEKKEYVENFFKEMKEKFGNHKDLC
jgi:DNA helicase-2/ATP-dependent DNA helicase PcrA